MMLEPCPRTARPSPATSSPMAQPATPTRHPTAILSRSLRSTATRRSSANRLRARRAARSRSIRMARGRSIRAATSTTSRAGETRDTVITYRVSDGQGGTAEATITVTVTGANDAPVALGPDRAGRRDRQRRDHADRHLGRVREPEQYPAHLHGNEPAGRPCDRSGNGHHHRHAGA